jgi:hypothetical protein
VEHELRIVVGDWSRDGHGDFEFVTFKSTHDRKSIIKGYKKGVKKAGIQLHGHDGNSVLTDYGNSTLSEIELDKFREVGITTEKMTASGLDFDFDEEEGTMGVCGPECVTWLVLQLTKVGLPEFEFELIKNKYENVVNGFWQSDFNHGFGYGVMGNF